MAVEKSDGALLEAWYQQRDADAFHALTQRYARVAYVAALRVLGNRSDAEDVTQECFEKLAVARKTPGEFMGPWIHRVATNRALDVAKQGARRAAREHQFAADQPADVEFRWDDVYTLVDRAIDDLPTELRRALVAYYLEGETQEALAQREGMARTTIVYRLKQAVEGVRKTLHKEGVTVPVALLGTLLEHGRAEGAAIPGTLQARLGRITLSGGALGAAGTIAPLLSLPKLLAGLAAVLVLAGSTVGYRIITAQPAAGDEGKAAERSAMPPPVEALAPPAAPSPPAAQAVLASTAPALQATTGSIAGWVVDAATGEGIAEARISIANPADRHSATTDESGQYLVGNLSPAAYSVMVSSANGYYLGLEQEDSRERSVKKLTVTLDGPAVADFALARGLSFRGQVVNDAGRPILGAKVTAFAEINHYHLRHTATASAKGEFEVSGFPETVSLYVWAEQGSLVSRTHGPYVLPQQSPEQLPVTLYPQAIIRGRTVDSAGNPIAGLNVAPQLEPSEAYRPIGSTSDALGRFELKGLFPGAHYMRVCRDTNIVNVSPTPTIEVAAGEVVEDVDLVCVVNDMCIRGRVIDAAGMPVHPARVEVPNQAISCRVDPLGNFNLKGLAAGTYTLRAMSYEHLPEDVTGVAAGAEGVQFVLEDAFVVLGHVTDAQTGVPIERFEVKWCPEPRLLMLEQDYVTVEHPEGTYELPVPWRGKTLLVVRAPGHLLWHQEVTLAEEGARRTQRDAALTPHPAVQGSARTTSGEAVSGALLFSGAVETYNPDSFAVARTDEDGVFVVPAEKIAHDHVTLFHRNYPQTAAALGPEHAEGAPLEIVVEGSSALNVRVTHGGAPVADAWVNVSGGGPANSFRTDAQGRCTITTAPAGEQEISVGMSIPSEPSGSMDQRVDVILAPGKTTEAEVDFPRGTASLSGSFLGSAPVQLRLDINEGPSRFIWLMGPSKSNGYAFQELPSGTARLRAGGDGGQMGRMYELSLAEGSETVQDIDFSTGITVTGEFIPLGEGQRGGVSLFHGSWPEGIAGIGAEEQIRAHAGGVEIRADGRFVVEHLEPGVYTFSAAVDRQTDEEGKYETVALGLLVAEITEETELLVVPRID